MRGIRNGIWLSIPLWALIALVFVLKAEAQVITDEVAVNCIMGEARGENYEAKLAHAEALRNRVKRYGKLWGVDGCNVNINEPQHVWDDAKRAWKESEYSHLTDGADHWHATYVNPYWNRSPAVMTAHIGKTKFYKGVK